jgi:serine phosphatase RsbU (regulator of sigma subunit)
MKLRLRAKLLSAIVVSGVLPFIAALIIFWTIGYRHRVLEAGLHYESEAARIATALDLLVRNGISNLGDLLAIGDPANRMQRILPSATTPEAIHSLDLHWAELPVTSPEIQAATQNPLARQLRVFQQSNLAFAEILVADDRGRLVAATDKTSDYDQSDEEWWQIGMRAKPGQAHLEGLHLDESSGAYSLDISMPIFAAGSEAPVGVIKAVLGVAPLFAQVRVFGLDAEVSGEIVDADGRVLLQLTSESLVREHTAVSEKTLDRMKSSAPGWLVGTLRGDTRSMVGYAPVHLVGMYSPDGKISGPVFHVIVHQPANIVLAPLMQRSILLFLVSTGGILLCAIVGTTLLRRNVLDPIQTLRRAAATMAATATRTFTSLPNRKQVANSHAALLKAAAIRTGDEIEELAHDFSTMAEQLLNYQADLQREIAEKTAEIQRDLDLARDFQHAFLPRAYPRVSSDNAAGSLSLGFHHIYQAAATVSGDFFDVVKLSDRSAGVLIADVMGHGTRSALVTAILRTLLHGLASSAQDPGLFLSLLNHHFHDTIKQTDQLIFVSVCYVVLDTEAQTLRCASAGHPSPLLANRLSHRVEPLFDTLRDNPALGLFPESHYDVFTRTLREQDVLLLFTDGVIEATSARNDDFGRERLEQAVRAGLPLDLASLTQGILSSVMDFTGHRQLDDDICLVAVEAVRAALHPAAPRQRSEALPPLAT